MISIKATRFDTNDDKVKLVKWLINDGDKVGDGATIAVLETSKATFDLVVDKGGFFKSRAIEGLEYSYEDDLGNLFKDKEEMAAFHVKNYQEPVQQFNPSIVLTNAAKKLVLERGITEFQIKALAKQIVREADIWGLLSRIEDPAKVRAITFPKHQKSIAKTVMRSHLEIPAAFITMRVYCHRLFEGIAELKTRDGMALLGIAEILVFLLGKLNKEYPTFYGKYKDEDFIPASGNCSVGVTFDVGQGLFLPRLLKADSKTLREIVHWFAVSRAKALRNSFKQEELQPGDISLSINAQKDVEFVIPFILPPQVCILSMGAIFNDWCEGPSGNIMPRKYFLLSMAYDHRVNNGTKVTRFLKALKEILEGNLIKEIV